MRNSHDTDDSDPKFLLSSGHDNTSFGMGFELRDENGLHCQGIQGRVGMNLGSKKIFYYYKNYNIIMSFTRRICHIINPSERWGTCYHASDTD